MIKGKSLDELINERKNNFDLIRFIAATLVIFSHAYPLTNNPGIEPFGILSNGLMSFGGFAVKVFFIISGFLITQSFDRSKDVVKYAKARILRIFPGLIVVVLLSVFVLGPIFTTLSLKNYFSDPLTFKYFENISLYRMDYYLPGVFQTTPNKAINGSLWTLWYEFFFYIVVAVLGVARVLNRKTVLAGFILATIAFHFHRGNFYSDLFRYFSAGMLFYLFRKNIIHNGWIALVSFIVLALTIKSHYFNYTFTVFGTYIIFYLSFHRHLKFYGFGKYGDFSYGLYIYAFPIQEMIVSLCHNRFSPLENFFAAFPVTLLFAVASWYVVEKRALKLKNKRLFVRRNPAVEQ